MFRQLVLVAHRSHARSLLRLLRSDCTVPPLRAILLALALVANSFTEPGFDRRVVDVVDVGNAQSEAAHGYDAHNAIIGSSGGQSFRQTLGWLHYTMTTFDDTEVTIACTFVAAGGARAGESQRFDLVVEDSVIATRTVTVSGATSATVDVVVPLSLTKGKTRIVVIVRAREGITPALRQLRTIQDHYELFRDNYNTPSTLTLSRVVR